MRASPVAQMVKNLPAMQETQVQSLGQEDPLEKGMATYASMLAWRIHGQGSLAGYSPWGHRVRHKWATNTFILWAHEEEMKATRGKSGLQLMVKA